MKIFINDKDSIGFETDAGHAGDPWVRFDRTADGVTIDRSGEPTLDAANIAELAAWLLGYPDAEAA